ncbi:MAG: glycine/sarcosine/betaine reductase selenoprotein B family protein [Pseudomonadota bacterium]
MSVSYIQRTRTLYDSLGYPPYSWFHADSPPTWAPLKKSLAECRLGMLATAGTYVAGQVAYYYKDDTSFRKIPKETPTENLRFSHITENYLFDAWQEPNTAFPIDALRRLENEGVIGELASNLFSCMGGIYSQRRVKEELIPVLDKELQAEKIDALLLVPL